MSRAQQTHLNRNVVYAVDAPREPLHSMAHEREHKLLHASPEALLVASEILDASPLERRLVDREVDDGGPRNSSGKRQAHGGKRQGGDCVPRGGFGTRGAGHDKPAEQEGS